MFIKRKESSPEDKLLKVIERSGSGHGKARPSSVGDFKPSSKKINALDLANRLISIMAVAGTIFFVFILNRPEKEIGLEEERPLLALRGKEKKDLAEYANIITEHNPFQVEERAEIEAEESLQENVDMKLVGILSDGFGEAQVFIEVEGKTRTCSEGDIVHSNIKVEKINKDHVILDREGTKIELK